MAKHTFNLHTINSFIRNGWREPTTWIGLVLLFGWVYHSEIHQLIKNILTSDKLSEQLVTTVSHALDTIVTAVAGYLVLKTKS
jgi:hypothetical protein